MAVVITKSGQKIIVDESEHKIAIQYKWVIMTTGNGKFCPITFLNGRKLSFSRLVFGTKNGQAIIHKNDDKLDYRRENIVICKDRSEFWHVVSAKRAGMSSCYHGVCFNTSLNRWEVQIMKDGKHIAGGRYFLEEEAALVADYLLLKYYRSIANRNFPELGIEQVAKKYNEISEKYGWNRIDKISKAGQGRSTRAPDMKTSQYVGVSWCKDRKKWNAQISHIRLGRFESEKEAAKAYDRKALGLYGEHAKLNLP